MNNNAAEILAAKISQTWGKAPSDAWIDFLCELEDEGRAGTAYVRLRDTCQRLPSMAEFRQAYNAVRGETKPERLCPECDGCGMVPEEDPATGMNKPDSVPCHCEAGDRMVRLIAQQIAPARDRHVLSTSARVTGLDAIARIRGLSIEGEHVLDELTRRAS